jgi:hypothetical protein
MNMLQMHLSTSSSLNTPPIVQPLMTTAQNTCYAQPQHLAELTTSTNSSNNGYSPSHQQNTSNSSAALTTTPISVYTNAPLPYNYSNKYVVEWLFYNRFGHLSPLFTNYTSNDLLRLTKDDMVNLCGAPDGIRCFNMAHNIQIKPKLTIFVTFQMQSYYSAVFLSDWKSKFLAEKVYKLYETYVKSLGSSDAVADSNSNSDKNNGEGATVNNNNENSSSAADDQLHLETYARLVANLSSGCELFLKIKDILVKTTDEVLNNLHDQSRFLIEFDTNVSPLSASCTGCATGECGGSGGGDESANNCSGGGGGENSSNDISNSEASSKVSKKSSSKMSNCGGACSKYNNKVKIIMIPLDQ